MVTIGKSDSRKVFGNAITSKRDEKQNIYFRGLKQNLYQANSGSLWGHSKTGCF